MTLKEMFSTFMALYNKAMELELPPHEAEKRLTWGGGKKPNELTTDIKQGGGLVYFLSYPTWEDGFEVDVNLWTGLLSVSPQTRERIHALRLAGGTGDSGYCREEAARLLPILQKKMTEIPDGRSPEAWEAKKPLAEACQCLESWATELDQQQSRQPRYQQPQQSRQQTKSEPVEVNTPVAQPATAPPPPKKETYEVVTDPEPAAMARPKPATAEPQLIEVGPDATAKTEAVEVEVTVHAKPAESEPAVVEVPPPAAPPVAGNSFDWSTYTDDQVKDLSRRGTTGAASELTRRLANS